jgi:YVTN family beta-propeller protein
MIISIHSSFAQPSPESLKIWTDKDNYNEGDTVTIFGKIVKVYCNPTSCDATNETVSGPIDIKVTPSLFETELSNHIIKTTPPLDLGTVKINSDGTFSTSFNLSGSIYTGTGTYSVNAYMPGRFNQPDNINSFIFTVGNTVGKVDPFQLFINQTMGTYSILLPDNTKQNYTTTGNVITKIAGPDGQTYIENSQIKPITRLVDPEGQIRYIENPSPVPPLMNMSSWLVALNYYGGPSPIPYATRIQYCCAMFGTWTIQTTWGDNISTINVDVPRHPPRLDILLYDKPCPLGPTLTPQYTTSQIIQSETEPCVSSYPSYDRTNPVKLRVDVTDKIPNQVGFSYQIVDPIGNTVISNNGVLIGKLGLNVAGLGIISNPSDNLPGVETESDFIKIPTDSFNLNGNYTIKIDYQGVTNTAPFQFDGAPVASPTPTLSQNLVNNYAQAIPVGDHPNGIAYDSAKGEIFVIGSSDNGNNTVSIINDATNTVVKTIPVGALSTGIAYDSAKGEIFVTSSGNGNNTVSIINDATNTVVKTIPVGDNGNTLNGIAYDSAKGEIFVGNSGSAIVYVISDATNTVVKTIPVGTPVGIAYDSAKGEIFVIGGGGTTVSVINDATNTVIATIPVGETSTGIAYDSAKGEIFVGTEAKVSVTNSYVGTVSVISDATNTVVKTIPVGLSPVGIAYDSAKGEIFVANSYAGTVSVISDATNTVIATIPVGLFPLGIAYDSAKGEIFVANSYAGTVSVISDATNTVIIPTQPSLNPPNSTTITTNNQIPSWVKNNAKWWHDNAIGDDDFEKGIQYLIQQKIIKISNTQQGSQSMQHIPPWVKNIAGFWVDGKASDDDFTKAIEYLMNVGIININFQNSPVSTPVSNPCKNDWREYFSIVYNTSQNRDDVGFFFTKQEIDFLKKTHEDCIGVSSEQQYQWTKEDAKDFPSSQATFIVSTYTPVNGTTPVFTPPTNIYILATHDSQNGYFYEEQSTRQGKKTLASGAIDPFIHVIKGQLVALHVINEDNETSSQHDLNIDEFNVHTKKLNYFEAQTIIFIADKSGTFKYYSSIHPEMKSNLIVDSG